MGYYNEGDCRIEDFEALCGQSLAANMLDHAEAIEQNIPVYDVASLAPMLADPDRRRALMAEWARVLSGLSGVLVLKGAVGDLAALDTATTAYERIIEDERATAAGGDHFATSGANDRIWNALQKLCLADAETFARSFANPAIDAVAEAWLGPGYQMTAQVNLVRPGGKAQAAHRDYHLGFMTCETAARYPVHMHHLSPVLTLQGAVAHCDMPVESGPTKLLPFSQGYGPGYIAFHLPEFRAFFEVHHVQLPLAKGDAVFFNPALFHAAGENRSLDIHRMANLLQVSSPMGRAMESIDREAMARALYPVLARLDLPRAERAAVIAASAEGYPFPTNLDSDPPTGGLAPESQAALMARMLGEGAQADAFGAAIEVRSRRRNP